MLPCIPKDGLDGFGIEPFEEEDHHEGVDKPDSTSVLQSIAKTLEEGQDLANSYSHLYTVTIKSNKTSFR